MRTLTNSFYLIFRQKNRGMRDLALRVTERSPALSVGEVAVYVTVALPDALFKRPSLRATITVPANAVTPATVDADVADNIAETVKRELGIDLRLTVEGAPE